MKLKYVLILICCLSLSGCFGGALVAGTAAGGAVAASGRTLQAIADDEAISYKISRKINSNKALAAQSRIVVVSYNRQVLLVGETPKLEWRDQIAQWLQDMPKVKSVYNEITVGDPIGVNIQGNDGIITANVKTRMLTTTNLRAREIKVITEDSTIYLMGLVTRQQANIAAEIARNSTGVKRVVKIFEYLSES